MEGLALASPATWGPVVLAAIRIGALFAVAPLFGRRAVSWRIKLMLALSVVALVGPAQVGRELSGVDLMQWIAWGCREAAIGLALGLAVMFLACGVAMAGDAVGACLGLRDAAPDAADLGEVSGRFLELTTFAFLVASGAHRWVVDALLLTFQTLPCGVHEDVSLRVVADLAGHSFQFAVRAAAPVVGAILAAQLLLAMLARSQPFLRSAAVHSTASTLAGVGAMLLVVGAAGLWAADELQSLLLDVQRAWAGSGS